MLARAADWGFTPILGELMKLGIRSASKNTVKHFLREHGSEPGPAHGLGTLGEFLNCTAWLE